MHTRMQTSLEISKIRKCFENTEGTTFSPFLGGISIKYRKQSTNLQINPLEGLLLDKSISLLVTTKHLT